MRWSRIGAAVLAVALVGAACGREADLAAPGVSLHSSPAGGQFLLVCKVGPVGTTATFNISASGGVLPLGATFEVDALSFVDLPNCTMAWYADDPAEVVTLTVTEVDEPGLVLDRILVFGGLDGNQLIEDPVGNSVTTHTDFVTRVAIAFKNTEVPFEEECNGLTPGYWKNWRNHYTEEQFAALLVGTIAGSIAEADAIFEAKGNNEIAKLKWFVLANQLTLNLMETDYPNPDDAELGPTCDALGGGASLGGTLETALDMLAHPENYTKEEILAIKDILDAIANLD